MAIQVSSKPRILVIGAGAVGGYVGGYLARGGHEIIFADPWPEHVEMMRRDGLRLEGLSAEECFTTPVRALHLTELQGLAKERLSDIAVVSMKSYDTRWAAALALQYLAPSGFVLSLQNGINEPTIAEIAGWGRTVGCVASKIVVELVKPGFIRRGVPRGGAHYTVFRVGEPHGRITPRVEALVEMLAPIDSVKATGNLWGERWTKLVQNAMSNAVSAATGLSVREMAAEPVSRRLSVRIAGETIRVGQGLGYALEAVNGLDPGLWVKAAAELEGGANDAPALSEVEDHMLAAAAKMSDTARPSMGQDMVKGRRTEIEHLNGLVVREAEAIGFAAPANAGLVAAVKSVEHGAAPASLDRLAGI